MTGQKVGSNHCVIGWFGAWLSRNFQRSFIIKTLAPISKSRRVWHRKSSDLDNKSWLTIPNGCLCFSLIERKLAFRSVPVSNNRSSSLRSDWEPKSVCPSGNHFEVAWPAGYRHSFLWSSQIKSIIWTCTIINQDFYLDKAFFPMRIFPKVKLQKTKHPIDLKMFDPSAIRWPSISLASVPGIGGSWLDYCRRLFWTCQQVVYLSFFLVIAVAVHLSGHSEIGHFDNSVVC